MTCAEIKFIRPDDIKELFADYVIVTREADNVSLRFYRQRPAMDENYDVADDGRIILTEEAQSYEAVLQASIVLPFRSAYYLLESLEQSDIKMIRFAQERWENDLYEETLKNKGSEG